MMISRTLLQQIVVFSIVVICGAQTATAQHILYKDQATAELRQVKVRLVQTGTNTPCTGKSASGDDIQISKNDGEGFANFAGSFTEEALGWYTYRFTTGEVDTEGPLALHIDITGCDVHAMPLQVLSTVTADDVATEVVTNAAFTTLDSNVDTLLTNLATVDTEIGVIDGIVDQILDDTGTTGVQLPDGIITAAKFGADAITAAKVAADVGTEIATANWANGTRTLTGTQAFNNTGTWTGNISGSIDGLTANALNDFFSVDSGTDYASAIAGSVVAEIADNSGGGGAADWSSGEKEQIRDALGVDGTKTAATGGQLQTVDTNIDTLLTNLATVDSEIGVIDGNVDTLLTNLATVDAEIGALNNLSAAQVNAEVDAALADYDAPTNTEMTAAFTEIEGGSWSGTTDSLRQISLAIGDIEGGGGSCDEAAIADAVWDELLAGHVTEGSAGALINDAINTTLTCEATRQ